MKPPALSRFLIATSVLLAATSVAAGQAVSVIRFPAGKSSTTLNAQVAGRQSVDYKVTVGAGQTLSVRLRSRSNSVYFNVLPPGSTNVAMVNGEMVANRAKRIVPIEGTYTIRVYLVRAAARRNERAGFNLTVSATGSALARLKADRDALVPGTRYHATSEIRMEHELLRDAKLAKVGIIRRSPAGSATLVLQFKQETRTLLFRSGKLIAWDSMQDAKATMEDDMIVVRVGNNEEVYRFPEVLLTGD